MTSERLCTICNERPARHGLKCWRCAKPYTPTGGKWGKQHAPGWEKVPYGVRLTLTEIANVTAMKRSSVAMYAQPSKTDRHLPPGFKVVRTEEGYIFLIREEKK